jgi:hypothetical protein
MAKAPPRLPKLGFAGFEDSPAAGGGRRRKPEYLIRPFEEPGNSATAEARRILPEAKVQQGIGRKEE